MTITMGPNLLTFHARSWLLAKLAMIWPPRAAVYSFLAISRIPICKCLGKDASFAARHQKKSINQPGSTDGGACLYLGILHGQK